MDDGLDATPLYEDTTGRQDVTRQGWRSAPDEVWAKVREDYLSGLSAPEAGRRHGVSISALRDRAAREGWRRMDQPWMPPSRLDPWDEGVELEMKVNGDLDQVGPQELSFIAHRRMSRAVLRGDAAEAMRWRRVREAMDLDVEDQDRKAEHDEAQAELFRQKRALEARDEATPAAPDARSTLDGLDGLDGILRAALKRENLGGAPGKRHALREDDGSADPQTSPPPISI